MENNSHRVVKDFYRGARQFGITIGYIIFLLFILILIDDPLSRWSHTYVYLGVSVFLLLIILSVIGFLVNYIPLKVIDGTVSVPASDQVRTFTDLITINPITGLYRRRTYNVDEIENVANGYTKTKRGTQREWNVVITGVKNGKSFSQRIDCNNKQIRDEVRNVLKQSISGKVNSDFAI